MSKKLSGRVAVITGAARGQGEATARLFVEHGARVVIADVLAAEGEALARTLGAAAMFVALDTSDEDGWASLQAAVTAKWGAPDILVNNAGVVHAASITELTKADFQRVLNINLIGSWLGIKTLAPAMVAAGKGAIVNICSTSALWGMNGLAAYSASKWALRGLTKTAAMELGARGVRVNAVFPGGINTKMGNIMDASPEELNKYYQNQPIRRIGEPAEVARASLYLASDDASYACGAELTVDGGMTLGVFSEFLPGAPD
ncbi:3-alpha-hydroxysteroid dehydrogenase [Acidocella aquatica]|uniref:3-alpha-hydroxysteroid dehydrogenase n=1 Tax=Acidocella aquatica TaxID=1922313 RepID=A0ABQ6A1G8_9PROT|nr:glucose 1-dehydrogenase [Acidocella aquatica]GLR65453.1 3-alpha-hydroxysteroid dehydrogenase [Acidocella aquatica]